MRIRVLILFLSSISSYSWCQTVQVKGRVLDSLSHEPLPFGNIFINNSTIGTSADEKGEFLIKNTPFGKIELVFSYVGYETKKMYVNANQGLVYIGNILLNEEKQRLEEVEVKASRDKKWEKQYQYFEEIFLGKEDNAKQCTILNPWVIDFVDDKSIKAFRATSSAPIEIENRALGYHVHFQLTRFLANNKGYTISGNVRFDEMVPSSELESKKWEEKRLSSYQGSTQHLLKSMVTQRLRGEGFYLYIDNPNTKANTAVRSPYFENDLDYKVIPLDTSGLLTGNGAVQQIHLSKRVEVHYHGKKALVRTYRDVAFPVSWIELLNGTLEVNNNGVPIYPEEILVSGDMNSKRVADLLPTNYEPPKAFSTQDSFVELNRFREKTFIQTDKPYYYQGEPLWFKGYANCFDPLFRDSLSRVMYVELINPEHKLIASKTLLIDHGIVHGDFILADTLQTGTYYLRSYTNWSRNFESEGIYLKPVNVVKITDIVDYSQAQLSAMVDDRVAIETNKKEYTKRDKVNLTIRLADELGNPIAANLSVSVTDVNQVIPLHHRDEIRQDYPFQGKLTYMPDLKYPVEYGLTIHGKFQNDRGRPEKTPFDVIKLNPRSIYFSQSDSSGNFSLAGLQFYDKTSFLFKSQKATGKKYGKFIIDNKRDMPSLDFKDIPSTLQIQDGEYPQRIISSYEVPPETRVLDEVKIEAKKIENLRYTQSYGKPDYVIEEKQINKHYGNLIMGLNGLVPGLVARQVYNPEGYVWVIYLEKIRNTSAGNPPPLLVTINNVAMGGKPADIIQAINPETVARIEVTTRINVLQGGQGAGGVLAIYTKTGEEIEDKPLDPNFQSIEIEGYSSPREFLFPDYGLANVDASRTDYRSTIYWNPDVNVDSTTGTATVNFYTADIPTQYLIEVEGITENNDPIRGEYLIDVVKN